MFVAIKETLKENFGNLERIWFLGKSSFKKQINATTLGVGWIFIQDLVYLLVFSMIKAVLSSGKTINGMERVPWLLAGLLPWFFVSDILNSGTKCFKSNRNIYSSMKFPIAIIPTYEMLGIFIKRTISFALIFTILAFMGYLKTLNVWLLLYYIVSMFVLCMVFIITISPLIAISKDFEQLYKAILKILFFLLPILWQFDQVEELSPLLAKLLKLNPIPYLMIGFRDAFYYGKAPELYYTLYFWSFNVFFYIFGCTLTHRLKNYFDDWV